MLKQLLLGAALIAPLPAVANVVTDWDETATTLIQGNTPIPVRIGGTNAQRIIAIMHLAMFEALNTIETKYESYTKEPVKPQPDCSQPAAAAMAARVDDPAPGLSSLTYVQYLLV